MFYIGQGLIFIILSEYLKSVVNLNVPVFLEIINRGAANSESISHILKIPRYSNKYTYLFTA